jgi:hypothetical protein
MKKLVLISIVLLSSAFSMGFKNNTNPSKITVCHVPPGNPGNCHEISVSLNALQAHLDHGDNLVCNSADELPAYQQIVQDRNLVMGEGSTTLIINFAQ